MELILKLTSHNSHAGTKNEWPKYCGFTCTLVNCLALYTTTGPFPLASQIWKFLVFSTVQHVQPLCGLAWLDFGAPLRSRGFALRSEPIRGRTTLKSVLVTSPKKGLFRNVEHSKGLHYIYDRSINVPASIFLFCKRL